MTRPLVVDQELVVHLFASTTGSDPASVWEQIRGLWSGCRSRLGMIGPIVETGLPDTLPAELAQASAEGAIAAQEDVRGDRQAVLRLVPGAVNLSVVLVRRGTSVNGGRRRHGEAGGERDAPSWADFDRMWSALVAGAAASLFGEVRIYLAKLPGRRGSQVTADPGLGRRLAPLLETADQTPDWWRWGTTVMDGCAVWETTWGTEPGRLRRWVVLAGEDRDERVSEWLWSDGGVAMPPAVRHLLNAAMVRHQVRVWEAALRPHAHDARAAEAAARLREVTAAVAASGDDLAAAETHIAALRDQEAELVSVIKDLRLMRHNVDAASANMAAALGDPPPGGRNPISADRALVRWFTAQLDGDLGNLAATQDMIARTRRLADESVTRLRARTPFQDPSAPKPLGSLGYGRTSRAGADGVSGAALSVERNVFVVHGRDEELRRRMFDFLRALDLRPLEWEFLVRSFGAASPFLGDVVAHAPAQAQAALVLLSPDDEARLHEQLREEREDAWETRLTGQPRPNVLIELGMVLTAYPERTLIVEVGDLRPIADITGRNTIRFDGSAPSLGKIVERLKAAGCAVDDVGADWRDETRFAGLAAYHRRPTDPAASASA